MQFYNVKFKIPSTCTNWIYFISLYSMLGPASKSIFYSKEKWMNCFINTVIRLSFQESVLDNSKLIHRYFLTGKNILSAYFTIAYWLLYFWKYSNTFFVWNVLFEVYCSSYFTGFTRNYVLYDNIDRIYSFTYCTCVTYFFSIYIILYLKRLINIPLKIDNVFKCY